MAVMNVTAKRYTTTGPCGVGRARIGQILITTTGSSRLTITDGQGGPVKFDADYDTDTHVTNVPGDGILFDNDPYISSATNVTSFTIFFM